MAKKTFITTVVIFLALPFLVMGQTGGETPQDFVLKVLETTDVHGALLPYDFMRDQEAPTSLAQVYSLVKSERSVDGQEVLLLDNGDILQGQPIVYYSNFEAVNKPHFTTEVMNYMGYDAGVVGNHDVEAGHAVYDKLVQEYGFPWMAANIIDVDTGEPYFTPYTVFERNGATIVVLGMCTPGVPTWLPENLWEGMEFRGMVETAEEWVPRIMEEEDPDILIGLFHAGTDSTYSGYAETDRLNPNASLLVARDVPGFDLVLTGHDHQTHNDMITNVTGEEVLILGGTDAARSVPVATFEMDYRPRTDDWEISVSGEIVDGESLPVDTEFMRDFAWMQEEVMEYVNKPIGRFTKTISTRPAMFGDTPFVDLIHRVQLEVADADVSFAAPLSMDAQIEEGQVYVRDMFQLYRYENLLYTMELTGAEIDRFLEYSYGGWFDTMEGPDDHLIRFKRNDAGELIWNERYNSYDTFTRYYNYDSAAGINYTVDVSQPAGDRVTISTMSDGTRFRPARTYTVAINSYRASGGGGHLTSGVGLSKEEIAEATIASTDIDLRYHLMKWIENRGTVTPDAFGNWSVEPVAWVEAAVPRDMVMMYGEE